jgi:hypothetical protein|tara:strand:+ start:1763 stop:1948 length:186 start_codon:yes stop_codon:yes gene_type:complete
MVLYKDMEKMVREDGIDKAIFLLAGVCSGRAIAAQKDSDHDEARFWDEKRAVLLNCTGEVD